MKFFQVIYIIGFAVLFAFVSGCSPLTKVQMAAAGELAFKTDSISRSPEILMGELAGIRKERGLFYAASLTVPESRVMELEAVADGIKKDLADINKCGLYVEVLNGYLRALKSLSAEKRHSQAAVEIRGIGRNIDNILKDYNELDTGYDDIPVGYASLVSVVLGKVTEYMMTAVQGKALKYTVLAADSLVWNTCDSLIGVLKSPQMNALIENEKSALKDNYLAFAAVRYNSGNELFLDADRRYVELIVRADALGAIRNNCVSALRSLKKAHRKLAENYSSDYSKDNKTQMPAEYREEVSELYRIAVRISKML